ncbi:IS3 family transposase [Peribacillus butanolivorans]|uniref:IS3 family transposase n=1 Tax=Peribacillus butanolivorans TaxID=421767 RepID=UPI002E1D980B|nr:IS3 family transposase [Peribacillus butanolivorans]MED3692136.1 IS3 family transposase [Peribacillus butanolivorans]
MAKFTNEEKISAVKQYLKGNDGYQTIAQEIGVHFSKLQFWVRKYEYHDEKAFSKSYTNYSVQYKLDVLKYMNEKGTSIFETAAIFNLPSDSTLWKWQHLFKTQGLAALKPKKKGRLPMKNENQKSSKKPALVEGSLEALKAENDRLRMENAYFKKVECLSSKQGKITKQDKAQVVYELRNAFPVKALIQLAEIPRSTYYYWVKNFGRPDPDAELKVLIKSVFDVHEGRFGYRRIRDELRNRGHKVNHKKVQRIMKELGLKCLVRMKKYRSYKGTVGKIAPNILDRDFKAKKPNEKWVTDITEFKLFGEKLYLSPVLDLFNGEIITYTIGSRPAYSLVSTMLNQAFERLTDEDKLLIHSDQGWHYQMKQYRNALSERRITQSMSRKGNCYDNAVMENFFGIMKSELLYLKEFESIEHFKQELAKYIDYYNNKRIKAKLKGMSPVQYRTHTHRAA